MTYGPVHALIVLVILIPFLRHNCAPEVRVRGLQSPIFHSQYKSDGTYAAGPPFTL